MLLVALQSGRESVAYRDWSRRLTSGNRSLVHVECSLLRSSSVSPPDEFKLNALFGFRVSLRPVGFPLEFERDRICRIQLHCCPAEIESHVTALVELIG